MITKILLVTIFILLSWNSFQQSGNLELLRAQGIELQLNKQSFEENSEKTQTLLNTYAASVKTLSKQKDELKQLSNKLSLLNTQLKESTSKTNSTLTKQISGLKSDVKATLSKEIKKLQSKLETSQKATLEIVKETRKLNYRTFDQIKVLSNKVSSHTAKTHSTIEYTEKKPPISKVSNKAKNIQIKQSPIKTTVSQKSNPFYDMSQALYKTKNSHKNKKMDEALKQLSTLKSEVWKSRKVKNIPQKDVMSILSSIDIVKSKWDSKESNYQLDNVEKKIIQLFYKLGIAK